MNKVSNIVSEANKYHTKYKYHEVNITIEVSIISRAKRVNNTK